MAKRDKDIPDEGWLNFADGVTAFKKGAVQKNCRWCGNELAWGYAGGLFCVICDRPEVEEMAI